MQTTNPLPDVITVKVTRKDLKNEYCNSCTCPIAVALKRQFPEIDFMTVGTGGVVIGRQQYRLPASANRKARNRGAKLLGQIIGGFTFQLKIW